MAPTSLRSIEGGSSARPAAYDFLGVVISTVCTWNSFLKFRAILGKEGSLLILNQFSSYIPRAINLNRQGHERACAVHICMQNNNAGRRPSNPSVASETGARADSIALDGIGPDSMVNSAGARGSHLHQLAPGCHSP